MPNHNGITHLFFKVKDNIFILSTKRQYFFFDVSGFLGALEMSIFMADCLS